MSETRTAIRTHGLAKSYGDVRAVDGIDLEVREGEIYGFLGRNGAGKTTTIRMILGLVAPSKGRVEIFGKDVARERQAALSQLGFLVESASAYPNLTTEENLELQRSLVGAPRAAVGEVIELLGLGEYAGRRAGKLSLGNKQRLSLARALLGRPRLLILDEPANGLDPAGIAEIRALLRGLAEREGRTIFMSSHILGEVELLADRIGIVHRGRLVEELGRDEATGTVERVVLATDDPPKAMRVLSERFPGLRVAKLDTGELCIRAFVEKSQSHGKDAISLVSTAPLVSTAALEATHPRGAMPPPEEIARVLVNAGLGLRKLLGSEEGLEERFLRLTGGNE